MNILTEIHARISEEAGNDTAVRVVDSIRCLFGGETVYIPRKSPFRAETVRNAVTRMSVKDAAKECGVTERRIYQLLRQLRMNHSHTKGVTA